MASDHIQERGGYRFVRLKSGRLVSFWDCLRAAETAETDFSRAVSRAFTLGGEDHELELLEWKLDSMDAYVQHVRAEIDKRRGVKSKQERIALLRNTQGRTPQEAEAYRQKADELQRRLDAGT